MTFAWILYCLTKYAGRSLSFILIYLMRSIGLLRYFFDVNGHELGAMGGDDTVEKDLDGENIKRGRSKNSKII